MKLFETLKTFFTKVKDWFSAFGKKAGDAYDKLEDAAKPIVEYAVKVVQGMKTFNESPTADVISAIIKTSIPGTADDDIVDGVRKWMTTELPKIAVKLELVSSVMGKKTADEKLKTIINAFQLSENRGEKALAFASQLAVYLEDGKFTLDELSAAANDYYNKFVKPTTENGN